MPLPVIAAAWAIGAVASSGAGAGGVGVIKQLDARKRVRASRAELERSEQLTAEHRDRCERAFSDLGRVKLAAMTDALVPFHEAFRQLKNVDLHVVMGPDGAPPLDAVTVADAGRVTLSAVDAVLGTALAGGAAYAASAGATAAVQAAALAGTGTAISSLSGAAATNATLAWIGGGTIVSGGGGMATGAVVMSGVAAAPAILVGGVFLFQKGRRATAKADAFESDVEAELARQRTGQTILAAAEQQAKEVGALLQVLMMRLAMRAGWLQSLVARETDWRALSREDQESIREIAVLAMATSDLVHTQVMDEDGSLSQAIRDAYQRASALA